MIAKPSVTLGLCVLWSVPAFSTPAGNTGPGPATRIYSPASACKYVAGPITYTEGATIQATGDALIRCPIRFGSPLEGSDSSPQLEGTNTLTGKSLVNRCSIESYQDAEYLECHLDNGDQVLGYHYTSVLIFADDMTFVESPLTSCYWASSTLYRCPLTRNDEITSSTDVRVMYTKTSGSETSSCKVIRSPLYAEGASYANPKNLTDSGSQRSVYISVPSTGEYLTLECTVKAGTTINKISYGE